MILPHFTTLKVELLHPVWWLMTIWRGVGRSWLMHMVAVDDAGGVLTSVTSYERLEYDHIRHTTPCALYRRSTDTWWRYRPQWGHLASTLTTRLGHTTMLTSGPVYASPSPRKACTRC